MNKPPAFQFYPDDYLGGTRTMTLAQKGAYMDLLCLQWSQSEIHQDDIDFVCKSLTAEDKARVLRKFKQSGINCFQNERLESERQKQIEYREQQAAKGRKGMAKRWDNTGYNTAITSVITQGITENNSPSPSPSPIKEERERTFRLPEIPPMSRKDFDALAELRGVPKECADWFWNTHDSRNWTDATGQVIRKIEPVLLNAKKNWEAKKSQGNFRNGKPQLKPDHEKGF